MIVDDLRRDDRGFTLTELLVSSMLFALVSLVIGGIMFSTMTSERSVRTVTSATVAGELVTRSVDKTVTNGATPFSLTVPTGSDQLFQVRTAGSGSAITWNCAAYYYNATAKTIRYTTSSASLGTVTQAIANNWTLLSTGVTPIGAGKVFTASGTTGVVLSFKEDAGSSPAVAFTTTITSQSGVAGSTPCF
jgi:prepilin-type N-terminal cleavage/methylation domain-containing protein